MIQEMLTNHTMQTDRDAAVMLPLVREADQSLSLLFEVRSLSMRSQPGEICFPGGRIDPDDKTPEAAASRELCEELGLSLTDIHMLSPLEPIMSPRRGTIFPFVCYIAEPNKICPNQAEVSSTFRIPLTYLLENPPEEHQTSFHFTFSEDFPLHLIANRSAYTDRKQTYTEHVFHYDGRVIWGLTARIMVTFLSILKAK
ncbi:NUDIX hydrolase [Alkalicoccobacillus murimartini]|nr:CoA pyrophosphatase [Alkalicoccobacillus murimartini]